MIVPPKLRLKNTIKHPTSIIVGGLNRLGLEIAESLIRQGGYVIIVDAVTKEGISVFEKFSDKDLISFLDYTAIPHLEEDVRRLDYVFYFGHESIDFRNQISTQEFLTFSNYLDAALSLAVKFDARFLLTTAIKAHQLFLSDNGGYDFSLNSGITQTYTDMEVQRYAEGLVMEYHQKVKLNTRIIRLGELIGDGIDFGIKSAFVDLIVNAARKENLLLYNDGLETEWFVHFLDAAYGLIKSQFSKDTNGKVFTIAYENTFTHLSIAYKIQEIEDEAKEIRFVDEDYNSPPLKIHKPASNLSVIGWMPRISFEKAVKQSLAAAKVYLIERGFQAFGEMDDSEDPVAGLLQKKASEDQIRRQRLLQADQKLKAQNKSRQKTFSQKLSDTFWKGFVRLANVFTFLKKKSPLELAFIIFIGIIFIGLYFAIISPALVVTRNVLLIPSQYNAVKAGFQEADYQEVYSNSSALEGELIEIQNILNNYRGLAGFFGQEGTVESLDGLLESYISISSGVKDISFGLMPFNSYAESFQSNLQLRNSSESLLSVAGESNTNTDAIKSLETGKAYVDKGIEKFERGITSLERSSSTEIISPLVNFVSTSKTEITEMQSSIKSLSAFSNMPFLLGNLSTKTYLILLLDNSVPTPMGGRISAFALVSLNKGGIENIQLQSIEQFNLSPTVLTVQEIEDINSRRFNYVNTTNIAVNDLASASTYERFARMAIKAWEEEKGVNIDGVITMDLDTVLNVIQSSNNLVDTNIGNVDFSRNDILFNITAAQAGNVTLAERNNILTQLFARSIFGMFEKVNTDLQSLGQIIFEGLEQGSINMFIENADVHSSLKTTGIVEDAASADSSVSVGLMVNDIRYVEPRFFVDTAIEASTLIDSEFNLVNTVTIKFPNLGVVQEVSVCFPSDSLIPNSVSFSSNDIPSQRVTTNSVNSSTCVVAQTVAENSLTVNWALRTLYNEDSPLGEIRTSIAKFAGTNTIIDYTVRTESPFSIMLSNLAVQNGAAVFSGDLTRALVVDLEIGR